MKNIPFVLGLLLGLCVQQMSSQGKNLKASVSKLVEGIYVHTSYHNIDGKPYPSNGLVVSTSKGALLIDTGWDEPQTSQILSWIDRNLHQKVILCIVTHYHADRLGGIKVLREQNVPVESTPLTAELAKKERRILSQPTLPDDTTLVVGTTSVRVYYPGEGHTKDNIVIWFPAQKVLFGGCLIKSTETSGLGNIADANLEQWPASVRQLESLFADARYVIPGHQKWGGKELLKHTRDLLEVK